MLGNLEILKIPYSHMQDVPFPPRSQLLEIEVYIIYGKYSKSWFCPYWLKLKVKLQWFMGSRRLSKLSALADATRLFTKNLLFLCSAFQNQGMYYMWGKYTVLGFSLYDHLAENILESLELGQPTHYLTSQAEVHLQMLYWCLILKI